MVAFSLLFTLTTNFTVTLLNLLQGEEIGDDYKLFISRTS